MKLESLNCEKFEKIEKNELGMLVGGAVTGWTGTPEGSDGDNCTYSSDFINDAGTHTKYMCGADMTEAQLLKDLAGK
jgi:hypothetical protein